MNFIRRLYFLLQCRNDLSEAHEERKQINHNTSAANNFELKLLAVAFSFYYG